MASGDPVGEFKFGGVDLFPSLPKLTKGQKIGAGVGAAALAVILAVGAAALVMHSQGTLMSTFANIKATTIATGGLAAKVGAFIKAHHHYFIMGAATVGLVGGGAALMTCALKGKARDDARGFLTTGSPLTTPKNREADFSDSDEI